MKILFVENHPQFAAMVVKRFLSNHDVRLVPSIRDALAAVAVEKFDVVLLDYDLDDGKGTELPPHLKAVSVRPPVIAVSAHEGGTEALRLAGADAVCARMEFAQFSEVMANLWMQGRV